MRQQALEDAIRQCLIDWDGDFDIDVEQEDHHNGFAYFCCLVSHYRLGDGASFSARVDDDGDCEMEMTGEDSWAPLNMGNLFALMWFEAKTTNMQFTRTGALNDD